MPQPSPAFHDLRAVLLDYGGTLDGDAQHWFDHFVALYAEARTDVPYAALKDAFYAADAALPRDPEIGAFGLERMVRTHVGIQLRELRIEDRTLATRLADRFIADTRAAWDRNRPLLASLARRFRLGVVSNSYGNMPALLADAAFPPFAVVVDSAIAGIAKPDPGIYRVAATELGLAPASILHVGDSWERDVVAAHTAGMHTAWLARRDAVTPREPSNVWRLDSLLDLRVLA